MEESKGAFTENYVMSQLVATRDTSVFYYSNDAKLEIDFLIQHGGEIVPIEAKAEENLRAKSLSTFVASRPGIAFLHVGLSRAGLDDKCSALCYIDLFLSSAENMIARFYLP